jgi:hypothetical protein
MSKRRNLRRAWERRGFTVTEHGHGRVFDPEGRLVATYAATPGTQRSARADERKLAGPVTPHGLKREPAAQVPAAEKVTPARWYQQPAMPRPAAAHGFAFPAMSVPVLRVTPDEIVEAARKRREDERFSHTAARAVCDRCCERSGLDTRLLSLQGPPVRKAAWFWQLCQVRDVLPGFTIAQKAEMTARNCIPAIDPETAAKLARRSTGLAQLCRACWTVRGYAEEDAVTYRDIAEATTEELRFLVITV